MTIALFALTGFGNPTLRAMRLAGFRPSLLVTRRESGPHPYYPETDLAQEATRDGIPVAYADDAEAAIIRLKPDLILVSTYHRVLSERLLRMSARALNVHPSLLPAYRGPTPFYWALRNGERTTGVTVHLVSPAVDQGDVVWQRSLAIAPDETLGSLRRRLAELSSLAVLEVLNQISSGLELKPTPQARDGESRFPRMTEADRRIDLQQPPEVVLRRIRAVSPWPGAILGDMEIEAIESVERGAAPGRPPGGEVLSRSSSRCTIRIGGTTAVLRLNKARSDN